MVPELNSVIANLELRPLRLNESKNDKIGDRQLSHAQKLHDAGLLSTEGLKKVQNARREQLHSDAKIPPVSLKLSVLSIGFQDLEDRCQPTLPAPPMGGDCHKHSCPNVIIAAL